MNRGKTWATSAMAILALTAALTGCTSTGAPVVKSLSVADAKRQTQSIEDKIVALVPGEYIAKTDQQSKGVLMSCSSKGAVRWAGGTSVKLTGSPNLDSLLSAMQKDFAAKKGYTAQIEKDKLGNKTLEIHGPDEATWFVDPDAREPSFQINSWSPCFPLPNGMSPSDTY